VLSSCLAASGCKDKGRQEKKKIVPVPPGPAAKPELGRLYDLEYGGELTLLEPEPGLHSLLTSVSLHLTPKTKPLDRIDLWPGLDDISVCPQAGFNWWSWHFSEITSDRPMRVEASSWGFSIFADKPVPLGEKWNIQIKYKSPVSKLASSTTINDMLGKFKGISSHIGQSQLFQILELLLSKFTKESVDWSYVDEDFFVLMPPWPLVFDCGGKAFAQAFPPTECVARHGIKSDVRLNVPPGWEAVLPTKPVWEVKPAGAKVARVDRLPTIAILSPSLKWKTAVAGKKKFRLCAPTKRGQDLDLLARLISDSVPALQETLGEYPLDEPIVCLSPMPVEFGGLARGRLALVAMETFDTNYREKAESGSLQGKLIEWIATDPFFRSLREETVLHELAHHWWQVEMPDRWERLFMEGVANFVSVQVQHRRYSDEDLLFFTNANLWLDAVQTERAGVKIPTLLTFLNNRSRQCLLGDALAPYTNGTALFEMLYTDDDQKVRWEALRKLHHPRERVFHNPEHLVANDAQALGLLQLILKSDLKVKLNERVDPFEVAKRLMTTLHEILPDSEILERILDKWDTIVAFMKMSPASNAMGQFLGVDANKWAPVGQVLQLLDVNFCLEPPQTALDRQRCRALLMEHGPGVLAAVMALDDHKLLVKAEKNPEVYHDLQDKKWDQSVLQKRSAELLRSPAQATEAEARSFERLMPPGEALQFILFTRVHARWAARAYQDLFMLGGAERILGKSDPSAATGVRIIQ
jgi:hypothetical protein